MARLINIGTGEMLDRLSILSLKVLYGELAGKDTAHYRNERNALLSKVTAKNGMASWIEEYGALAAVNAALWHAEDELRTLRRHEETLVTEGLLPTVARCAFRIQQLNDDRSKLIAAINQKTGEFLGEEKL